MGGWRVMGRASGVMWTHCYRGGWPVALPGEAYGLDRGQGLLLRNLVHDDGAVATYTPGIASAA